MADTNQSVELEQAAADQINQDYGADKIKVLEGLEAVRKRPAMYIGSTGPSGLHHLVYEVVDNSIDEALAGFCDQINVTIHIDGSSRSSTTAAAFPPISTRAGDRRQKSCSRCCTPAASSTTTATKSPAACTASACRWSTRSHRSSTSKSGATGRCSSRSTQRGKPQADLEITGTTKKRGTKITFTPDKEIFETVEFSFDTLAQRLRELAFLNAGILITLDDERETKSHKFQYDGGIISFVKHLNKNKSAVNEKPIYMKGDRDGIDAEIALQWNDGYSEAIYTFANNINTHEGGTHLSGLPFGADAHDQFLRGQEQPREGSEGKPQRRRHPRRADRGHQREDSAAAVRRADEDQARQHRGEGHRRGDRQRQARLVPRGEPGHCQAHHRQDRRCRPRARRGAQGARSGAPQGRARRRRPAGQARRLPGARSREQRALHRRGGVGRRLRETGTRPAVPGDPADQGQDSERREGALRQDARQRRDQDHDRGARMRHRRRRLRYREAALSPRHHHDRRGRRRVAHPHAAADVLLPADAGADQQRLHLHRAAAAVPRQAR